MLIFAASKFGDFKTDKLALFTFEVSQFNVLKSMHIMPRGHIETDPSTPRYFVTFSLEYPKDPCLIGILTQW